jgi:hypothetical protein
MLVGAAAFVLGIVVFFMVLKYLGIFTAVVFVAVFYFIGYASAIFAGAFWFFGLWLFGEDYIYLTTAISLLLFLLVFIALVKYSHARVSKAKTILNHKEV